MVVALPYIDFLFWLISGRSVCVCVCVCARARVCTCMCVWMHACAAKQGDQLSTPCFLSAVTWELSFPSCSGDDSFLHCTQAMMSQISQVSLWLGRSMHSWRCRIPLLPSRVCILSLREESSPFSSRPLSFQNCQEHWGSCQK